MSKSQLIEEIQKRNHSASAEFLAQFEPEDLADYLRQLAILPAVGVISDVDAALDS
jgi:hypothetical protein